MFSNHFKGVISRLARLRLYATPTSGFPALTAKLAYVTMCFEDTRLRIKVASRLNIDARTLAHPSHLPTQVQENSNRQVPIYPPFTAEHYILFTLSLRSRRGLVVLYSADAVRARVRVGWPSNPDAHCNIVRDLC